VDKGSTALLGTSAALPPNVRVTRQAAARARQAALQEQQLEQQMQAPGTDSMDVDTTDAHMVEAPLDPTHRSDPQECNHYVNEIYAYLQELEVQYQISPHFMQNQRDINAQMRAILIDWLVEVAEEYRLVPETLHLAVNYIDRFLSYVPVARSKLQLVGVTCMLIASKYEEIHPPAVDEFVYISDNTYKREEIMSMEAMILNRLNFELSIATAKGFLNRYMKAAKAGECDATTEALCQYLCELTLQEYAFLKYRPSQVAAAAFRLALHTMRLPSWTPLLEQISGFTASQLSACVAEMHGVFRKAESNSLQAVREKYSHAKFLCVSTLKPPETLPVP
jgi:cyclin A